LRLYAGLLRLYQRSGLQRLLRSTGALRALGMEYRDRLTPAIDRHNFYSEIGKTFPPQGERRARVAFLAGCMQSVVMAELNRATIRVLQRYGCEVVVPQGQTCCGALQVHAGMRDVARRLARQNITAFREFDAIITNTAGCGSVLKEYGDLLVNDADWADSAQDFAAHVRDVTEFLVALGAPAAVMNKLELTVTYQDPCHLAHAQKIRQAPRQLLQSIPGLKLVEMPRADQCCGSAGIYNVIEPEIATRVLEEKMDSVESTGAAVIATANPGCMLQLRAGVEMRRTGQRVVHVIELLDRAYAQPH
jgi:glycolate oxidase iron-sulfur subunit